jgi:hypothetical protein
MKTSSIIEVLRDPLVSTRILAWTLGALVVALACRALGDPARALAVQNVGLIACATSASAEGLVAVAVLSAGLLIAGLATARRPWPSASAGGRGARGRACLALLFLLVGGTLLEACAASHFCKCGHLGHKPFHAVELLPAERNDILAIGISLAGTFLALEAALLSRWTVARKCLLVGILVLVASGSVSHLDALCRR